MKTTTIYIERVEKETEKAILVKVEKKVASGCYSNNTFWLPKSQIKSAKYNEIKVGSDDELIIPKWLAYKLVEQGNLSRIDI